MNDFIFIQYTAGSCGKAIGVCLQTAKSVINWDLPNIKELAPMHTNDYRHVRQEPDAPYKLSWLARTHGINRGDNLKRNELAIKQTHEELIPVNSQAHHIELHTILNQEWNIVLEILENSIKTKLNRLWCKEYLATWHNQII